MRFKKEVNAIHSVVKLKGNDYTRIYIKQAHSDYWRSSRSKSEIEQSAVGIVFYCTNLLWKSQIEEYLIERWPSEDLRLEIIRLCGELTKNARRFKKSCM